MAEPDVFRGDSEDLGGPWSSQALREQSVWVCWQNWVLGVDMSVQLLGNLFRSYRDAAVFGPAGPGGMRAWWGPRGGVCVALSP